MSKNIMKKIALFIFLFLGMFLIGVFISKKIGLKSLNPSQPNSQEFLSLDEKRQYQALDKIIETSGHEKAWSFIKKTYAHESVQSKRAHDLAHFIGIRIYENKGLDGFKICDSTYAFGCYHGFSEKMFSKDLKGINTLERACESVGPSESGPWASCVHGIGHGVATYFDSVDLINALKACDTLKQGATYCHDGVFMEFSASAPPSFYKVNEPLYPCSIIETKYKRACARNQPYIMQDRLQISRKQAADICMKSNDPEISIFCIDAIGLSIGQESAGNVNYIIQACKNLSTEVQPQCSTAAAVEIIFQNYSGWQENAPRVCDTLISADKNICIKRIESIIGQYRIN